MKPSPITPGNSWEAFQQARLPSRIQWCEEQVERLTKMVEALEDKVRALEAKR